MKQGRGWALLFLQAIYKRAPRNEERGMLYNNWQKTSKEAKKQRR